MTQRAPHPISEHAQLRALASPMRQELLDLLTRTGPASAAELGAWIRRPADGLYYHLRALQRAKLVTVTPDRGRRGRRETVFRAVYREPAIRHDPLPGGNSPAVATIVGSMLRLGIRDFRKACASPGVRTEGPSRDLWALRVVGWLTPGEVAGVNRGIRALRDAVGKPRSKGKLYSITILLTPLEHRTRRKHRRPRGASGRDR